jgi:predicted GIY-YIG superfamily endonuclease
MLCISRPALKCCTFQVRQSIYGSLLTGTAAKDISSRSRSTFRSRKICGDLCRTVACRKLRKIFCERVGCTRDFSNRVANTMPQSPHISFTVFPNMTTISRHVCYLLYNGKQTYIGYTSQTPEERLAQHNGRRRGGAKATRKTKGEWRLALTVTGFASRGAALRFEYAWKKAGYGLQTRIKTCEKLALENLNLVVSRKI